MSTPCVFYPWEPRTSPSPLSSTIENILCWVFFQDHLCGFIDLLGAIYRSCPNCERGLSLLHLRNGFNYTYPVLIPTAKGTRLTLFAKGLQVHTPRSCSNYKRNLINWPPLPHATMGSDTTCWGDKHLGKFS